MRLEVAGGALAVLALLGWAWGHARLRRRIVRGRECPRCGEQRWQRVHRRLVDRLFGVGVRVRRYRCENCTWEGFRRRRI